MPSDGLAHHCILAHQYHSLPSERHADLLHLLGAHIVCSHNEAFWIIIQKLLQKQATNKQRFTGQKREESKRNQIPQ